MSRKTEKEVEEFPTRLPDCPLCGSKNHDGHERCFHCSKCDYLQCCDNDGFYDKQRAAPQPDSEAGEP